MKKNSMSAIVGGVALAIGLVKWAYADFSAQAVISLVDSYCGGESDPALKKQCYMNEWSAVYWYSSDAKTSLDSWYLWNCTGEYPAAGCSANAHNAYQLQQAMWLASEQYDIWANSSS
jgi:hypothetical protein